jgi:hypothetical protein
MGQGINMVTGDYSRGAAGYWVENGELAYPVQEITIAGNLKDIFRGIAASGTDVLMRGSKQCGSILIDRMTVAGDWKALARRETVHCRVARKKFRCGEPCCEAPHFRRDTLKPVH